MSDCNATFWKNSASNGNHSGDSTHFDGPQTHNDLTQVKWNNNIFDHMGTDISNIQTSPGAWVSAYDQTFEGGNKIIIVPNADINMKEIIINSQGDTFNDVILSFVLSDSYPGYSNLQVCQYYQQQYPKHDYVHTSFDYYSQDSQYAVHNPNIVNPEGYRQITLYLEHLEFESPDTATVVINMDTNGNFVESIGVDYTIAEATQVPKWLITITDEMIAQTAVAATVIMDGAIEAVSDGVATPVVSMANDLIKLTAQTLTFVVDHSNAILATAFLIQDDGGRTNFVGVVSHSMARAIYSYYQALMGPDPDTSLTFDDNAFFEVLGLSSYWDTSTLKHCPFREVAVNGSSLRIYKPETTNLYAHGGAVVSFKLDLEVEGQPDEHLILIMTVDSRGRLFSVVGNIDVYIYDPYNAAPSSNVVTYDSNRNMIHVQPDGTTQIMTGFPNIAEAFKSAMTDAWNAYADHFMNDRTGVFLNLIQLATDVVDATDNAYSD